MQQQHKLICDHMNDVSKIAKHVHRLLPSYIEYDDVYSNGLVGLVNAAKHYDENQKVSFRHYASFRIKGAILDGLRGEGFAPRNKRGTDFCDGVSLDDIGENHNAFDKLIEDANFNSVQADYLVRLTYNPQAELESRSLYRYLLSWFNTLPARIPAMLKAYYVDGRKLKNIADEYEISESRVCQIATEQRNKTLVKLKAA